MLLYCAIALQFPVLWHYFRFVPGFLFSFFSASFFISCLFFFFFPKCLLCIIYFTILFLVILLLCPCQPSCFLFIKFINCVIFNSFLIWLHHFLCINVTSFTSRSYSISVTSNLDFICSINTHDSESWMKIGL